MQRFVFALAFGCLAASPAWAGDDPPAAQKRDEKSVSASEDYQALLKQYRNAEEAFNKAIQDAKTPEQQNRVFQEKYPKPDQYTRQFLAIAETYPQAPESIDALVWVATHAGGLPDAEKALTMLRRDHVASDKLGPLCQQLVYNQLPASEPFLREVLEKNPNHDIQGIACYALARTLKSKAEQPQGGLVNLLRRRPEGAKPPAAESEEMFERVVTKYGNVKYGRGTLGASAKGELFEIRNLAVGKTAPEIEGQEIAGKPMKLSDYKGKVVVLDFWGNW